LSCFERQRRFVLGRTRGLHDYGLEGSQVGVLAGAFEPLEESPVDRFAAVDELGGDHDNRMFGGACDADAPKASRETSSTSCPQCSAALPPGSPASAPIIVVGIEQASATTDRISARLFWLNSEALRPGRDYLFKLATTTVKARVEPEMSVFDLETRSVGAQAVVQNEFGSGTLKLDRPIAVDRYADCKDTGSFILIDPESHDTVGMGCVEDSLAPQKDLGFAAKDANTARKKFVRWTETHARSLAKAVSWRATGSLDTFIVAFVITGSRRSRDRWR